MNPECLDNSFTSLNEKRSCLRKRRPIHISKHCFQKVYKKNVSSRDSEQQRLKEKLFGRGLRPSTLDKLLGVCQKIQTRALVGLKAGKQTNTIIDLRLKKIKKMESDLLSFGVLSPLRPLSVKEPSFQMKVKDDILTMNRSLIAKAKRRNEKGQFKGLLSNDQTQSIVTTSSEKFAIENASWETVIDSTCCFKEDPPKSDGTSQRSTQAGKSSLEIWDEITLVKRAQISSPVSKNLLFSPLDVFADTSEDPLDPSDTPAICFPATSQDFFYEEEIRDSISKRDCRPDSRDSRSERGSKSIPKLKDLFDMEEPSIIY